MKIEDLASENADKLTTFVGHGHIIHNNELKASFASCTFDVMKITDQISALHFRPVIRRSRRRGQRRISQWNCGILISLWKLNLLACTSWGQRDESSSTKIPKKISIASWCQGFERIIQAHVFGRYYQDQRKWIDALLLINHTI